jgi:glycine/D-amino acid oxidase-like deaminating enzyme/nitrite reductase/ring-hydroxylating ferredoxin subunit
VGTGAGAPDLPGRPVSLWLDGAPLRERPPLARELQVDVAVLGGGIVGVTAALLLAREGASVALLEGRRIGFGVTGNTTAKLTSLHGLTYARLRARFGDDVARAYGEANEAGIAQIARLTGELGIDCELRRKPNYTYAESADEREGVEREVEAAASLGLPGTYTEETELPYGVAAAIRFDGQAEFHPYRYVTALAEAAEREGCAIHERTMAVGLDDRGVRTAGGATVRAERVIVATHIPFLDRGLYFTRTHPERSYALAVRVARDPLRGMYLSAGSPVRSLRSHPAKGGELLIVAGESHRVGASDERERYRRLEAFARERFPLESIEHRWSAQDNMPADGLPYVGRLLPFTDRVLVATGFRKWGLALGAASASILGDMAIGRKGRWAAAFDPARLHPTASARELLTHNAHAGLVFFGDRITKRGGSDGIGRGEGRVVRSGVRQAAAYRDREGRLHELSARCTHLGCIVRWNRADGTWDCPCHGSRFASTGEVIQGPATAPLARRGSFESPESG